MKLGACVKGQRVPKPTWTIPRVAEVTGSEKSPPGGDTGDAALPLGGAQAGHPASPLIEGGQTGPQVGGVPRVGRHLCQSP